MGHIEIDYPKRKALIDLAKYSLVALTLEEIATDFSLIGGIVSFYNKKSGASVVEKEILNFPLREGDSVDLFIGSMIINPSSLNIRKDPSIKYERHSFESGNKKTGITASYIEVENPMLMRLNKRVIKEVVHNAVSERFVFDEWFAFSYGNEILYVKHDDETKPLMYFDPYIEMSHDFTFQKAVKGQNDISIVARNNRGDAMRVAIGRPLSKGGFNNRK